MPLNVHCNFSTESIGSYLGQLWPLVVVDLIRADLLLCILYTSSSSSTLLCTVVLHPPIVYCIQTTESTHGDIFAMFVIHLARESYPFHLKYTGVDN